MRRLACAAWMCWGCTTHAGGARQGSAAISTSARGAACDRSGKRIVELDLDRDGTTDVRRLFARRAGGPGEYLACKEVDLNHDGRVDMWTHHAPTGERVLEEMDLDFDARVDLVSFWGGGKLTRQEVDTDYNGRPDILRYFDNDKLARVERDTDRDGRIDHREFYEGGVLDRIGYDDDGDGKTDRWERAAAAPTAETPPPAPAPSPAPKR
jgi:hypothetical protein